MRILWSGIARQELAAATAWFQENSPLGGAAFALLIRDAVERISEVPLAAPRWAPEPRFRAWTVQKVNYRVFYELLEDAIRIVAVAHTSRRPGYWLDRLK
jgi:toxin ParE1/3/4